MRYQQPYGVSDANAVYVNGDPSIGRQGSIPPGQAIEHPQREIINVISKSGFVPAEANLLQLAIGVRSQRLNYAQDTGVQNALVVAYDPPITEYNAGLTLHVRVRYTNNAPCTINAGAGTRSIRKMNGAPVGDGELPQTSIVQLIYDGTQFQLANFGGAGGITNVSTVNVPYTEDQSPTPGTIIASFMPGLIDPLEPGDIIAVKVKNTAPGATTMQVDIGGNLTPYQLVPNGVPIASPDRMLQGDIIADDVVQFFYDGAFLRFPPNPEITAPVTYMIGPGQQFATFDDAMVNIRRKTIGADGFVTLRFIAGAFPGPINISHPSGDRLAVRGTMLGAGTPPGVGDFTRTGSSAAERASDAGNNIAILRSRYGTEITLPDRPPGEPFVAGQRWNGITNLGAGRPLIADLLLVGLMRTNDVPSGWDQNGVHVGQGQAITARNVAVFGSQMGFSNFGSMVCEYCFATANTLNGFTGNSSFGWYRRCSSFGNAASGFSAEFSSVWTDHSSAETNGGAGWACDNNGSLQMWFSLSQRNGGSDLNANVASSMILVNPAPLWGTTSPPVNQVGNFNSIIVPQVAPDPGPPIGTPMPPTTTFGVELGASQMAMR